MTYEQEYLTALLRASLTASEPDETCRAVIEKINWDDFIKLSWAHKLVSYVYDTIVNIPDIPDGVSKYFEQKTVTVVKQNFRLLFWAKNILDRLAEVGADAVLLKGATAAVYYPNLLYRKSGDIDILIFDEDKLADVQKQMEALNYKKNETQSALHHVVFSNDEGIEVEIHTMLAEPFDNMKVNDMLDGLKNDIRESIVRKEILGIEIPVLREDYQAFELLLHMLQHYLRSGFGIRLLCDWVVFWNSDISEEISSGYSTLCDEFGVKQFSDMITQVCAVKLGLNRNEAANKFSDEDIEKFWNEFWVAEEFGKSSATRMVNLQGSKKSAYVKEFHHQMHLNFPKAGKCPLLWPVLWVITLVRFLVNNRRIRKVSLKDVLKSAGDRGKLNEKLHIFEDIS
ncbi:MAG: nucleotidyltransferase family protein [Lachnospiraceae bacterium]|nr:nucleotidyltransferase family protein [Lachnospiraceae bacterium]